MPNKYKFHLTNGKTLTLEGETQPSDADAEAAAKEAGVTLQEVGDKSKALDPKNTLAYQRQHAGDVLTEGADAPAPKGTLANLNRALMPAAYPQTAGDFASLALPDVGLGEAVGMGRRAVSEVLPSKQSVGGVLKTVGGAVKRNPNPLSAPIKLAGKVTESVGERMTGPARGANVPPPGIESYNPNTGGAPTVVAPATIPEAIAARAPAGPGVTPSSRPMPTDQPLQAMQEIAQPGARKFMDEEFARNNPIAQQALGRARVGGPAPVADANALARQEAAAAPRASQDPAAQASGKALAQKLQAEPTPTATFQGWQEGAPAYQGEPAIPEQALYNIEGGPSHQSTVSADTLRKMGIKVPETPPFAGASSTPPASIEEAARQRLPQEPVEGNIPASKSRSSQSSATPGLTVADVEGIGMNPDVKITKLTPDLIKRVMTNRAARHGVHRANAQMDAFNRSQGIDPLTADTLDVK